MARPVPVRKNIADRMIYLIGFVFAIFLANYYIKPSLFFNLYIDFGIIIGFCLANLILVSATASDWAEVLVTKKSRRKKITTYRVIKLTMTILFNLCIYFILVMWKNAPVTKMGDYVEWGYIIGGIGVLITLALVDIIVEIEFQARIPSGWNKTSKRNVR